ncbi:unnamed protein product [Rhizophagus irregularis]|nr:unnamed protein product [Rhizophagus irregularis]
MAGGPAKRLLNFASEIKEKTSRAFSLSNTSSETLASNNKYVFSETLKSVNKYLFSEKPVSEHMHSEKLVSINQYEDENEWYSIYKDLNWRTSPTVKVGIINKISEPYNKPAEGLAKMGKKVLEFIKSEKNFQVSYRIELRPIINQEKWEYIMQLDSTAWFDMLLQVTKNLPLTLRIARNYVNNIMSVYNSFEYVQSTKISILSRVYCGHHADCKYPPPNTNNKNNNIERPSKNHNLSYAEPPIFCAGLTPTQFQTARYCNWYVEKERIVLVKDGWVCVSHQDDVRDILICSNPMYGMIHKPDNHKTNKDLVIDGKFWEWVLSYFMSSYLTETICGQCISNPIELFALNFESDEAKDSQAKECHGHLHVHIKPEVVIAFEKAGNIAMYGKIGQPGVYAIQNCMELELYRLMRLEMEQGRI